LMTPVALNGLGKGLPAHYVYADETARGAAELMATEGLATLPVVDRRSRQVSGTLSLQELLHGRTRSVERESERLRLFGYIPPEEGGHN
jgi:chloride channel protein, CIC family